MAEQRIVLVDSDANWRKNLKSMLVKLGYWVVGESGDGLSALKMIRSRQPDLVILEVELPGMSGLELARIVHEDKLAPVVVMSPVHNQGILEKAKDAHVAALVPRPVEENALYGVVELALTNYQEIVRLETKVKALEEKLETRKITERAKGILMQNLGITEDEAFKRMQKQSMNKRVSLRQVAEAVILAQNLKD